MNAPHLRPGASAGDPALAGDPYPDSVRLEQALLLPLETLPGHAPDSRLMQDFATRAEWFLPSAVGDRSWLAQGRGVTFAEMIRLAAHGVPADRPVDLAITVTATPDSGDPGYPSCLLPELLPGAPAVLGLADQGAAGPFTALRLAADRIASGGARRAAVLLLEQCRVPPEPGIVLPARDRAVLLVLGPRGCHRLRRPRISRTPLPADAGSSEAVASAADARTPLTPVGGEADASEGITGVWASLAEQLPRLTGRPLRLAARDEALSYWCSLDLDPVAAPALPPMPTVPGSGQAHAVAAVPPRVIRAADPAGARG